MPDSFDRETLIDRATDALNEGDPEAALAIADEIRVGVGPNADEALIRGIALSSLGRSAPASDAFAEAMRRAPESHKARFNAAVHEFNAGNACGAKEIADEAARLDPAHGGTRDLLAKIEETLNPTLPPVEGMPPVETVAPAPSSAAYAPYPHASPAAGTLVGEPENLPWIGRMGPAWLAIGIAFVAISFLAFLTMTLIAFRFLPGLGGATSAGDSFQAGLNASRSAVRDPLYNLAAVIGLAASIGTIFWTTLDLVRHRGNFAWLVGVIPLSCLSFGWVIAPIYMLVGRKGPSRPPS